MNLQRNILLIIVILFLAVVFVSGCSSRNELNRHPSQIYYSKHARCRMGCRHIDENEVKEIMQDGKINYAKSELNASDSCRQKYAMEGYSHDNQHLRIIFASCNGAVTVVTVIDLGYEWPCDCR